MPSAANTHADRAKQFIPFAALRGFYELVADVSRHREPKRDLLPDHEDELDAALQEIEPGDHLTIRHYANETYTTTTGTLTEIREQDKTLLINDRPIPTKNIFDIEYTLQDEEI